MAQLRYGRSTPSARQRRARRVWAPMRRCLVAAAFAASNSHRRRRLNKGSTLKKTAAASKQLSTSKPIAVAFYKPLPPDEAETAVGALGFHRQQKQSDATTLVVQPSKPSSYDDGRTIRKRKWPSPTSPLSQQPEQKIRRGSGYGFKNISTDSVSPSIAKYWGQRYSLFSKYDEGIQMDEEGWYSVTPELIAAGQAARVVDSGGPALVLDSFCGVGGNSIQFAKKGCFVIATDIDPNKVHLATNNAIVYGVEKYIDFVIGDFFQIAPHIRETTVDVAFLSPPWGGPSYSQVASFSLHMLRPRDGYSLFKVAQRIARSIIMFLPRNVDIPQLDELSWFSSPPHCYEIEPNFWPTAAGSGRVKAITAYFGDVVKIH